MRQLRDEEIRLLAALQDFQKHSTEANRQRVLQLLERVEKLETEPRFIAQAQKEYAAELTYRGTSFQPNRGLSLFTVVSQVTLIAAVLVLVFLVLNLQDEVGSPTEPKVDDVQATEIEVAASPFTPICGGDLRIQPEVSDGDFRRELGLTSFTGQVTDNGVVSNRIRAVTIDERGVWFGYYPYQDGQNPVNGIGQYDRTSWELCKSEIVPVGENVNDIAIAPDGKTWVATDGFGVAVLDEQGWHTFTSSQGLPDDHTYSIVVDSRGVVWVATYQGVAKFDGEVWSVPYTVQDGDTIINNHVGAIAFHPNGEVWIGYLDAGLSRFTNDGEWLHYSVASHPETLASDNVRNIVMDSQGHVWIATFGGGVSQYDPATDHWTIYNTSTSNLPNNDIHTIAIDKYDRVWAATDGSVVYLDGSTWHIYAAMDALSVAFGLPCDEECPGATWSDEHVWLGTVALGLTHSRIPQPSKVIEVVSVDYKRIVQPDEQFKPSVTVRVLPGYELKQGDGLFYAELDPANLFGAHDRIAVTRTVSAGQSYEFLDFDNSFTAPSEPGTYRSLWRVWASGRYVGEPIVIEFTVSEPEATQSSS